MSKIQECLETFKAREADPKLKKHVSKTQECFGLAARELEIAILEDEPPNLIAFIPPACITLVHEALHFDPEEDDSWEALAQAAVDLQSGPS